jgi:hypothetical protein
MQLQQMPQAESDTKASCLAGVDLDQAPLSARLDGKHGAGAVAA